MSRHPFAAATVPASLAVTERCAIRLEGVSHRYGQQLALDHLTLELPVGGTIGLVGPDGIGKSTLLGLIAGVKKLQQGRVHVLGGDMRDARFRRALSPRVAYMPQGLGRNLYPTLTVYDNIDFFARLFGQKAPERRARIERLLKATGLAPFPDRPAGKLSGGMKQKLGLCCALVHDPDLLVLDEPTTGVDPLSRRQFWALVTELCNERPQMTVLVATAYMEEAERFDHLVAMDAGRVLVSAPTAEVLARTAAPTLEDAYVALLPPERRGSSGALLIPPLPTPSGPPAIEAKGLTRTFGAFTAVKDVSFRIERGEIFGFLGSNGCGKTTTMKMLAGLLDITEGEATLLGQPIGRGRGKGAGDMAARLRVGYMSQGFSLYEELTVRQNLELHAKLYRLANEAARNAIDTALDTFQLRAVVDAFPGALSLGIRQRLQLAAACLHRPEVLILDEPTSGVDPAARDMFWRHLVKLSRQERVTIFVSTHFMNEAQRCDRISLMHRGRVLAVGTPAKLCENKQTETLEQAFIDHLLADDGEWSPPSTGAELAAAPQPRSVAPPVTGGLRAWFSCVWAFAVRESIELLHDRIRLSFALIGPIVLLCAATWGVTFDVERIPFTVLDHDRTVDSRRLVEHFAGSAYFSQQPPLSDAAQIDEQLLSARSWLVIDIPPHFGSDLVGGRQPEVAYYIDGGHLARAAYIRNYAQGIALEHAVQFARSIPGAPDTALPVRVEPRFTYNQEFRSVFASAPSVLMVALILIPAMLTALGVVREKEMGSITNLYASPASVGTFLLGKQMPYLLLTMASYLSLVFVMITVFGVAVKGSFLALTLGALAYVFAVTALGLMVSALVNTQVAALFLASIVCVIVASNFAGLLCPVSTLPDEAYWIGMGFPASWFQLISLGAITKGLALQWNFFGPKYAALLGFGMLYLLVARALVRKQEA
ncbi:ribosome-associated ATPase/putative transporter RbbA [Aquabacterium sp. CECT 9606]|uniref:ribosome-associated ATPase/putative transporter RbbA n=1 Tax=Aquabacterium sp. CECT 9606 TaxID=2845822 RepID=UPI001E4ED04B|nr:ribosome-associated ATPase/putative transporter RbbA [Aquabacterium sp. CECT 9606]CAH0350938.1 Ribosome-associated ATPase [Aquabacterium sp. CECT 9606]